MAECGRCGQCCAAALKRAAPPCSREERGAFRPEPRKKIQALRMQKNTCWSSSIIRDTARCVVALDHHPSIRDLAATRREVAASDCLGTVVCFRVHVTNGIATGAGCEPASRGAIWRRPVMSADDDSGCLLKKPGRCLLQTLSHCDSWAPPLAAHPAGPRRTPSVAGQPAAPRAYACGLWFLPSTSCSKISHLPSSWLYHRWLHPLIIYASCRPHPREPVPGRRPAPL